MSNPRILVAEDSSVIQNITRRVLQVKNYEIVTVKNGRQVLEKLAERDFALILMDINMPVMDGISCAMQIRALPQPEKASVPIVAITGNAMDYTQADFERVGIDTFLQKPLDFDQLVSVVEAYLED